MVRGFFNDIYLVLIISNSTKNLLKKANYIGSGIPLSLDGV
jgi:hypothetical protein